MKQLSATFLAFSLTLWFGFFGPLTSLIHAQTPAGGNTVRNAAGAADIFGTIEAPEGVAAYDAQAGTGGLGLMVFFSNVVRLISILAGLWVFVNFLLAGFTYITSAGDSSATKKVYDKIIMSVIGLVIIASSYTIAGIASLLLFGRADFILNPSLIGIT